MIEVRPAPLAQVVAYRGRKVEIDADVGDVAVRLREIHPDLRLMYAIDAEPPFWQVERHVEEPDGSTTEHLVLTSMDLGAHIVERVRYIDSGAYDFAAEAEKQDREADARLEQHFEEQRHEVLERLAHAVRKDLGLRKNH
jgi:hypothetical protein